MEGFVLQITFYRERAIAKGMLSSLAFQTTLFDVETAYGSKGDTAASRGFNDDENASGEGAPLLAYLRELQRQHHVAVLLVHHARKSGAKMRCGQALRGSSEFDAWGDSNLYLRRHGDQLTLTVEHRAAPVDRRSLLAACDRGR